jgi:hypothetical protein
MSEKITGGCQCGAVRYALFAMPDGVHICHCRMCQKAVGGPFAALAPVGLEHFAWTRGAPEKFESSSLAYRHYCASCGTPLSFGYNHKPRIAVTIGSLDNPERAAPNKQYGSESRLPWCDATLMDLRSEETEVTVEGQKITVKSFQHPDHDTPAGWTAPSS